MQEISKQCRSHEIRILILVRQGIKTLHFSFQSHSLYHFFTECLEYSSHNLYQFFSDAPYASSNNKGYITNLRIGDFPDLEMDLTINHEGEIHASQIYTKGKNENMHYPKSISGTWVVYKLQNFRGTLTTLFSCQLDDEKIIRVLDGEETNKLIEFDKSSNTHSASLVSVNVYTEESSYCRPSLNKDIMAFKAAQLIGINVPLLIVQNIMERDVITKAMIDNQNVNFTQQEILLKSRAVVFDLDETLIWDNAPIAVSKLFLRTAQKNKIETILLTRHKDNLTDALTKIGLFKKDFDKIIRVFGTEKKSAHLNEAVIFIDNEFLERYDVRENTGSEVLNLDVLKYCKLLYKY